MVSPKPNIRREIVRNIILTNGKNDKGEEAQST